MRFRRKRYLSAGIPVSPACRSAIVAGDKARDGGDWPRAAGRYQQALDEAPTLNHIRIQLGHALKEQGLVARAEREYRRAQAADPSNRDATLQLGHILKLTKQFGESADCYMSLAIADAHDDEAMREACDAIRHLEPEERRALASRLVDRGAGLAWAQDLGDQPTNDFTVVYDASDLLSYFSHARRPTGIQRVQIETIVAGLRKGLDGGTAVGVCCFVAGRDEWVGIPATMFLALAAISLSNDADNDIGWTRERDRIQLWLLVAPTFEFAMHAVLVNLGTSWWLQNYFLHVRDAQRRRGIIYIPMIYDMIPILFPSYCIDDLVRDFVSWLGSVFTHTTQFLAISQCSKRDLIATAARSGHVIDDADVVVIPLDADFAAGTPSTSHLPAAVGEAPFVLQVSTIEPRKGHLVALEAWTLLIERLGAAAVPKLVFVGRKGWRNAAVYDRLAADPVLSEKVVFLSDLSDAELSGLYRRCLFTIYPSFYEGWGLPVTEALGHGKVVITTTSSSLPEAGGDLVTYIPPGDAAALTDAAYDLITNPLSIASAEAAIVGSFAPRSWSAIADQIGLAVTELAERSRGRMDAFTRPRIARPTTNYWLARSYALELRHGQTLGEEFRAGLGWEIPDDNGSRVKRSGGVLAWRAPTQVAAGSHASVSLRLLGQHGRRSSFTITSDGSATHGTLAPHERLDIVVDIAVPDTGEMTLLIRGDAVVSDHDTRVTTSSRDTIGVECFSVSYADESAR